MNAPHTEGPWRYWECKDGSYKVANDYIQIASGSKYIAQVRIASVTEGDMRLMAASPCLLAAAKKALAECADLIATPAGEALQAAIKKAIGGAE